MQQVQAVQRLTELVKHLQQGGGHHMPGVSSALTIRTELANDFLKEVTVVRNRTFELVFDKQTQTMVFETRFSVKITSHTVSHITTAYSVKDEMLVIMKALSA